MNKDTLIRTMTDSDLLMEEVSRPISSLDVNNLLNDKIRILDYKKLREYNDINELFKPYGAFVLLYEWKQNFGHWVCVFKDGNIIEHFDSYGVKPDYELNWVPEFYKVEGGEDIPYLTYLLYKSGKKIRYNHYKLQSKQKGVATCGRWCVMRLIFRNLTEHQFYKKFNIGNNPLSKDILITYLTENLKSNI